MNYERAEHKWKNTAPIRGREEDVRPIGERRRTHECIEREAIDEGLYAYHAVLYGTKCVTWYPNGDVVVRTGGYQTVSTAEFIHQWSPFGSYKHDNKVWVQVRVSDAHPSESVKAYPVGSELRLNYVHSNLYKTAAPVMINKQVINRVKAKEARAPLQPFLSWAKAFLTLSDGWVMHETRKEVLGWKKHEHGAMHMPLNNRNERDMYKLLTEQADVETEYVYLRVLACLAPMLAEDHRPAETYRYEGTWANRAQTYTQTFDDYQVRFDAVKRKVYAWVTKYEDVQDVIEVEAGRRPVRGAV